MPVALEALREIRRNTWDPAVTQIVASRLSWPMILGSIILLALVCFIVVRVWRAQELATVDVLPTTPTRDAADTAPAGTATERALTPPDAKPDRLSRHKPKR